jgi:hypothetical protein
VRSNLLYPAKNYEQELLVNNTETNRDFT